MRIELTGRANGPLVLKTRKVTRPQSPPVGNWGVFPPGKNTTLSHPSGQMIFTIGVPVDPVSVPIADNSIPLARAAAWKSCSHSHHR